MELLESKLLHLNGVQFEIKLYKDIANGVLVGYMAQSFMGSTPINPPYNASREIAGDWYRQNQDYLPKRMMEWAESDILEGVYIIADASSHTGTQYRFR